MHINTAYNPSSYEREKVNETYPQYLRESAQNIIQFLEEYYQYLNRQGFASYEVSHVISENDIDFTSEKYLDAIQGEIAKVVPQSNVIDRNTLYKRIIHYYRIKGTPESVEKFFAIFFDAAAEVYFPGKDLFKLSEGDFEQQEKYFIAFKKQFSLTGDADVDGTEYIRPTNNPTLGDNFTIEFTSLLYSAQYGNATDGYGHVFATDDGVNSTSPPERPWTFTGSPEDPGILNLSKTDADGAHLIIKQEKRRYKTDDGTVPPAGSAEIIRLSKDIYDDKWHNIKIDYSTNDDGVNFTPSGSADIVISNSNIDGINGTYSQQTATQWTLDGATYPTGLYASKIDGMIAFYAITDTDTILISGEEYIIVDPTGVTNWTSIGASASTIGTIFTYNGNAITTTGSADGYGIVKHRPNIWHLRKYSDATTYDIVYRDGLCNDYHDGGSTRVTVTSAADISNIYFVEETSGQTQQSANVVVRMDGEIIANEKISHNRGYSAESEKFRIFHRHRSNANIDNIYQVDISNMVEGNGTYTRDVDINGAPSWKYVNGNGDTNILAIKSLTVSGFTYYVWSVYDSVDDDPYHNEAALDGSNVYRSLTSSQSITPWGNDIVGWDNASGTYDPSNYPIFNNFITYDGPLSPYGTRGLLSHFKISGQENNFEYRFTKTDATTVNSLFDYSGNGNNGVIANFDSAIENLAIVTPITQFTLTNFNGGADTANGVYTVSNSNSIDETWTGPNGHKFVVIENAGLYNWQFFDADDLDPSHLTSINAPRLDLLPKPWQIEKWTPDLIEGAQFTVTQTDKWSWENSFGTLATKPSAIYPLPFLDNYGTNSDGFLSNVKKLQDSEFWQDYSYQIKTSIPANDWSDSYNRLVHPTGMKFFIALLIESVSKSQWDRIESYIGSSENNDSWLFNLVPPIRRSFTESYQGQHTPRYQPGWLQSVFGQLIIAIQDSTLYDDANKAAQAFATYLIAQILGQLETSQRELIARDYTNGNGHNPGLWSPYLYNYLNNHTFNGSTLNSANSDRVRVDLSELGYMDIPIGNFDLTTKYVYYKENFENNSSFGNHYTDIISNTGDSDFIITDDRTAYGKTKLLKMETVPDGAAPQLGLRNDNYENELSSGIVEFVYYAAPGHEYIGNYWHIGNAENVYSTVGPQIVGGAWTKATVYFGSRYGGKNKPHGDGQQRFLFGGDAADPTEVTTSVRTDVATTNVMYFANMKITTEEDRNTIYPFTGHPNWYKPIVNFSNPHHTYINT